MTVDSDPGQPVHETASLEKPEAGLRSSPFRSVLVEVAVNEVFSWVEGLYSETGLIIHQLIGLKFIAGRAIDSHIEIIKSPEKVSVLIDRMRGRWNTVAHVYVPERRLENLPGLPHPERRTLVVIDVHYSTAVATTVCRVNRTTRRMTLGRVSRREINFAPAEPGTQGGLSGGYQP